MSHRAISTPTRIVHISPLNLLTLATIGPVANTVTVTRGVYSGCLIASSCLGGGIGPPLRTYPKLPQHRLQHGHVTALHGRAFTLAVSIAVWVEFAGFDHKILLVRAAQNALTAPLGREGVLGKQVGRDAFAERVFAGPEAPEYVVVFIQRFPIYVLALVRFVLYASGERYPRSEEHTSELQSRGQLV